MPLSLPATPGGARLGEDVLERSFEGAGDRKVLTTGFIGRRTDLHRVRRRIRQGERVFVLQGLGGLGKSTLAFHVLPMLGAEDNDVCTLWCQEVEQQPDRAEAMVTQLLEYCRRRFGSQWEPVAQEIDQLAGDDPVMRFTGFFQTLLSSVPRLVLYLDNLESLLVGPNGQSSKPKPETNADADENEFGRWHSQELAAIWNKLVELARDGRKKLHIVASCRYRHDDFGSDLIPVSPLPADALFRVMGWFPALRRLAGPTRARLVGRLAGHPRAVEYANDLLQNALDQWTDHHGEWRLPALPTKAEIDNEWQTLVEPALPRVQQKLRDDLLLAEIWTRVLDEHARRMLYRMTLLRQPWEWDLMNVLGEPDEADELAQTTAERLRRTSLLEQVELFVHVSKDEVGTARMYTLHPATVQFITDNFAEPEQVRPAAHRRIGEYLEARAKDSPYVATIIEAGHHLFEAGEYDRSSELLGAASVWLRQRGRVREALRVLQPFLADAVQEVMDKKLAGQLLGTVALAHHALADVNKAIGYYEQRLVIAREIGDRSGEGNALGNLGNAYAGLGEVEKAIGYYGQILVIHREIGDRRGEGSDLGNLGVAYARLGEVEKAIGYYEQALVISREIGDRRGEGSDLGNLGLAYADLGEVEKAIGYYKQILVIHREIGDRRGEGNDLGNLGVAYARLGEAEKAIGLLEQALRIGREIKDAQIIQVVTNQLERLRGKRD